MVSVGDRISLALHKGAAREGLVTGVTGSMLRVRWGTGEETTVIPGPGTLTVLGRAPQRAPSPKKGTTAAGRKASTKASPARRATAKRAAGTKTAGRKASAKPAATKRARSPDSGG